MVDEIEWVCEWILQKHVLTQLMLIMWIGEPSLQVRISNLLVIVTLTCSRLALWMDCGSLSLLKFILQKEDPRILKYAVLTLSVCLRRWPTQETLFRKVLQNTRIRKVCDCIDYYDPLIQ